MRTNSAMKMFNSSQNQKVAFSIALFSIGGFILLLSSSVVYYTFYKNYIPPLVSDAPLYFDYTSTPNALIPVSSLGLMNDQKYSFSLKLKVPNSPHNFQLGNFMAQFTLLDSYNNTIISTARPGLVMFKSPLLLTIHTLFSSIWLLLGTKSESQSIVISLMELYSPKSKDFWIKVSLSTKDLHISEASLGVKTYLRGLRYFMYEWPFITGLLMVSLILVAQIMVLWGIYESILTLNDRNFNSKTKSTEKEKKIRLKKKKSQLSRKSSVETVTARFDSSYASLRTITPIDKDLNDEPIQPLYPESPSPWSTSNSASNQENGLNSEPLATIGSNVESLVDTTVESIDEISEKSEKQELEEKPKSGKVGTSYSFFPPTGVGALSYSMSFSAVSAETQEDVGLSDAVNSWREGLDGHWSE